jgi:hypothetical protein
MFAAKDRLPHEAIVFHRVVARHIVRILPSKQQARTEQTPHLPKPNISKPKSSPSPNRPEDQKHSAPNQPRPAPTRSNPSRMNTYTKRAANPSRMRTYKIIGLKVPYNEHLQKIGGWGSLIVTQPKTGKRRSRQSDPHQHLIRT